MTKPTSARIYRGTAKNLRFLAARLRAGDLVAVPTETVYGLAANALEPKACHKIFRAKGRPLNDPLIVHIHSRRQMAAICRTNPAAEKIARKFWPGPLTMVLPKKPGIPDIVSAGLPSIAVRMPRHPLFRRLLRETNLPLAAPSANPFGYVSPTTAQHVRDSLGQRISHILDGGPSRIGLESTIVDLRDPERPKVLRPGAVSAEALARVLGCPVGTSARATKNQARTAQVSPGLLARHYSPHTPVMVHPRITKPDQPNEAYVFLRKPVGKRTAENIFWFHERGSLPAVARNLFALLRRLDGAGFRRIHVERASSGSLAAAINDRLTRAASR